MEELKEVNEKTDSILTIEFYDEDGLAFTPSSGSYTIIDLETGTVMKTATTFTPSSSTHSLTLLQAVNTLVNQSNDYETRVVYIEWTYSGSKVGRAEKCYKVRNLKLVVA